LFSRGERTEDVALVGRLVAAVRADDLVVVRRLYSGDVRLPQGRRELDGHTRPGVGAVRRRDREGVTDLVP